MRDMLIKLIDQKQVYGIDNEQPRKCDLLLLNNDELADHLLANGVTVNRWIPVSERTPERAGMPVLVVAENSFGQKRVVQAFTNYEYPVEFETNHKEFDMVWKTAWKVTHWMPLPEPPSDERQEAIDAAPVVHWERKFGGLDFDGVDEILKKHRAFVMATINGHGCHIGTYKKIALEADGDWIIDVDVESLDVTGQGDFAPVVHGEWIPTTKHKWETNGNGEVDEFAWDREFHNGPVCTICGTAPCIHCHPDYDEDDDCNGHFVCSECGRHEKEQHLYCHCGAKMDGGAHEKNNC